MPITEKHHRFGFTMIELLVVMAIIVGLASVSISGYFYMERSSKFRRAMSEARTTFSAAGEAARWLQAPAWVSVDPETGEVTAYGLDTVASWHFERKEAGEGIPLKFQGNVEVTAGYAGDGILVGMDDDNFEGGSVASVPVGLFPDGGYFECYVRPMYYGADQVIFRWGKTVSLTITITGRVEGRVGGQRLYNPDIRVNLFRWTRFALLFSRDYASIIMDDAVLDGHSPENFPALEGLVEVPAVDAPVHGYLDEARILRVRVVGRWKPQAGLMPQADERLYLWFGPDGTLDPEKNPGPFKLRFSSEGDAGRGFNIEVTAEGEVSVSSGQKGAGDAG